MTPNLWWVFDSEEQSFSTLPTGPFLAPFLILFGLIAAYRAVAVKEHTLTSIAGPLAETNQWKQRKDRYDKLLQKMVISGLELNEDYEIKKLEKYLLNPWKIGS